MVDEQHLAQSLMAGPPTRPEPDIPPGGPDELPDWPDTIPDPDLDPEFDPVGPDEMPEEPFEYPDDPGEMPDIPGLGVPGAGPGPLPALAPSSMRG